MCLSLFDRLSQGAGARHLVPCRRLSKIDVCPAEYHWLLSIGRLHAGASPLIVVDPIHEGRPWLADLPLLRSQALLLSTLVDLCKLPLYVLFQLSAAALRARKVRLRLVYVVDVLCRRWLLVHLLP